MTTGILIIAVTWWQKYGVQLLFALSSM